MNCALQSPVNPSQKSHNPSADAAAQFAALFAASAPKPATHAAINATTEPPVWPGNQTLPCYERINVTHDSVTFVFAPLQPARFHYQPGQFVTIGVAIEGSQHYRAYSMSSSPSRPQQLAITVKRVPGGRVSNFLLDHAHIGHPFHLSAPAGEFFLDTQQVPDDVVLLSAGSGITPMMSISRWLLDQPHASSHTRIRFVHSAQSERDILFKDELLQLAAQHPNFELHLFLAEAEAGTNQTVPCQTGLLTPERLSALLPDLTRAHLYLCGPQGYMDMVDTWRTSLPAEQAVPDARFHKESFAPAPSAHIDPDAASFELNVPASNHTSTIRSGQTLLDALEQAGLPIIGACRSGVCGSCKCTVTQGEVTSTSSATLTPEQIAQGVVLACSSTTQGPLEIKLGG